MNARLITRAPFAALATSLMLSLPLAARAADCWMGTKPLTRTGFGAPVSNPKYARLVNATERAEALLRADARINAIPGVRLQIDRSLTLADHDGGPLTASTWLRLHLRDVWGPGSGCVVDQGRADYMNRYSVSIDINAISPVAGTLGVSLGGGSMPAAAIHPDAAALLARSGVIRGDADAGSTMVKAVRLDGKPLVVPVTVREHLAHWERVLSEMQAADELAALRAHRSRLSDSALDTYAWASPEAMAERMWGYATSSKGDASPLVQIAPDLLQPTRDEGGVRFVVVSVAAPADEDDAIATALRDWLASLDREAIASIAGETAR